MNTRNRIRLLGGLAGVVVAAGVAYACKDFLDTPAQGTLDEQTLANRAGVEGSLIAAYRSLDCSSSSASWGCAASNWVWGSVTSDDAYKGSESGDQQPINEVETYFWSVGTVHDYLNGKWAQVYEGVVRSNATLRLLRKVLDANPGEVGADSNAIRGEAVFLRAHYHFEAYRMWGQIPYYREDDTDFRKTNMGVDAVAEILTDLNEAITLLPASPRNGDKGRATSWAAKAYKGRVQAYDGDWDGALLTLRDVVNNGPYDLEASVEQVWTGFANLQNGPETVLAFQGSVNDGEPSGWNSNWGERLNFPHGGSHFGCCGFHQPTQNLVNFFKVDANGLPLALTDATWNTSDVEFDATGTAAVDPRLDWTVGRDNVPYKDWGLHNQTWIRDLAYGGPYSPKKNIHENASKDESESTVGWVPTQTNSVNIHILRYADVLLLLAEAEVERGTLEAARGIVNQVRTRAAQSGQGCGSPPTEGAADSILRATYPACVADGRMAVPLVQAGSVYTLTQPWGLYRIGLYPGPWTDQAFARRAVRYERRLELALEGQRFFDLRRWGGADTVIANYIGAEDNRIPYLALATTFSLPKYLRYPIPSVQIELSNVAEERLQQNPVW